MIRQDVVHHLESAEQAAVYSMDTVTPKVKGKLSVEEAKLMCTPNATVRRMNMEKTIFEVPNARDPAFKYLDNLVQQICLCGKWQTNKQISMYARVSCVSFAAIVLRSVTRTPLHSEAIQAAVKQCDGVHCATIRIYRQG